MNRYDEAVRRLADGFSSEFAEFCAGDERMHELIQGAWTSVFFGKRSTHPTDYKVCSS